MAITAEQTNQIETLLKAHPEYSNARIAKEVQPQVSSPTVKKHRIRLGINTPTRQSQKANGVHINYVLTRHAKIPERLQAYIKRLVEKNMFIIQSGNKTMLHPSCDIPYLSEYFDIPEEIVRRCVLRELKAHKLKQVIDESLIDDIQSLKSEIEDTYNLLESTAETFETLQLIRDILLVSKEIEL